MAHPDDVVLAGMSPSREGHPFEYHLRRIGTSLVISGVFTGLFLSLVLMLATGTERPSFIPPLILGLGGALLRRPLMERRSAMLLVSVIILGSVGGMLLLVGLGMLLLGQILLGLVLSFSGGMFLVRLNILRNPTFLAWYDGQVPQEVGAIDLGQGEMLAQCPSCASVLAIQPLRLSPQDHCPHCDDPLVTDSTLQRLGLERQLNELPG